MFKWFLNLFKEEVKTPTKRYLEIHNYLYDILDYKHIAISSIPNRIKTNDIIHENICMITCNNKDTNILTIPYDTLLELIELVKETNHGK